MALLNLTTGLHIGHPEVDRQHQQIVDTLNDIAASFGSGAFAGVESACATLRGRIARHFRDEAEILRDAGFPEAETHAAAHNAGLAKIEALLKGCDKRCRHGLPSHCLADWVFIITDHIVRHDLEFKSFLQERDAN